KLQLLHRPVNLPAPVRAAQATHLSDELEKTLDPHVAVAGRAFGQIPHLPLGLQGLGADIETTDGGAAAIRREKAGQHLHGGGLAGPVGPQNPPHLPPSYFKGQVVHGDVPAEPRGQAVYLYHDLSRTPSYRHAAKRRSKA